MNTFFKNIISVEFFLWPSTMWNVNLQKWIYLPAQSFKICLRLFLKFDVKLKCISVRSLKLKCHFNQLRKKQTNTLTKFPKQVKWVVVKPKLNLNKNNSTPSPPPTTKETQCDMDFQSNKQHRGKAWHGNFGILNKKKLNKKSILDTGISWFQNKWLPPFEFLILIQLFLWQIKILSKIILDKIN